MVTFAHEDAAPGTGFGGPASLSDSNAGSSAMLRTPPHNFEAEQGLLGSILHNNRAYERVSEFLRPEHFAHPVHGRIYAACATLIERGQVADPVTLRNTFADEDALAEVGGSAYLDSLVESLVTTLNAAEYGKLIYDMHLRRELIALGEDVVNDAFDFGVENAAAQQIEIAEQKLYDLATTGAIEGGFKTFETALVEAIRIAEAAYRRDSHIAGITTGFRDIDTRLGGLHPSDLLIIAGRPAMGKTSLATNIAFNAANAYSSQDDSSGAVVGFFSLEMSAEQLATRLLAEQAQISSDKIRRGELSQEGFDAVIQASGALARIPLFIDDTPALSVSALRTRARRLKRQHGLGLIVVDYLQLLQASPGGRTENRVQELSEITRGLKTLAKELNVPVIALSQLSRAVEQREDKRPLLSDLRESGSIEQDADVVMFIFREQYYVEKQEPVKGIDEKDDKFMERQENWHKKMMEVQDKAEVIVAKQRHGPTGAITLHFRGEFTKFSDYAEPDHYPDQRG
ncbi:MAG: replicative DNA helicase [Alphaproteobacteria bacterium]|nr:replicative DNA helicase [Alphaproteobacteria bacterium]